MAKESEVKVHGIAAKRKRRGAVNLRIAGDEASLGEVRLGTFSAVLHKRTPRSSAAAGKRAAKRPGGRRTTLTIPARLDDVVKQISSQANIANNEALLALASHAADLIQEELVRAESIEIRRQAVLSRMAELPLSETFPSDEEIDQALTETAARD